MINKIVKYGLLLGIVLCCGCQKDRNIVSLTAEIEGWKGMNKVYLDNENFACWNDGDIVNINNCEYCVNVDGENTHIDNVLISEYGFAAGYPANKITDLNRVGGKVVMDQIQQYQEVNGVQQINNVMVGYAPTADDLLCFRNVGAMLGVAITNNLGNDIRVEKIQIRATASNARLWGIGNVTEMGSSQPILTLDQGDNMVALIDINKDIVAGQRGMFYMNIPSVMVEGNTFEVSVLFGVGVEKYRFKRSTKTSAGQLGRNQIGMFPIVLSDFQSEYIKVSNGLLGEGTEDNPYLLSSSDDFNRMGEGVDNGTQLYFKQVQDIDLNGSYSNFKGVYDGGGNTINISNSSGGVFNTLSGNAIVKHVNVRGTITGNHLGYVAVGGLVNSVNGDDVEIDSCNSWVECDIHNNASINIGGICGRIDSPCSIRGCGYYGQMNVSVPNSIFANVGGIIGFWGATSGILTDCKNEGTLCGEMGQPQMGGIIGKETCNVIVDRCVNKGVFDCNSISKSVVGGIVGASSSANLYEIKNCVNRGKIMRSNSVGGIVGETNPVKIENCFSESNYVSCSKVGGLVYKCSGDTSYLNNCCVSFMQENISGCTTIKEIYGESYGGGYDNVYVLDSESIVTNQVPSSIQHESIDTTLTRLNDWVNTHSGYAHWEKVEGRLKLDFED